MSVSLADVKGDGITDLAIGTGTVVSAMLGNEDGRFQPPRTCPTGGYAYAAVGDFDGDGKIDLAVNVYGCISVFRGNGYDTFRGRKRNSP